MKKIGFCCKFIESESLSSNTPLMNTRSTTMAWMGRQTVSVAESKIIEIVRHNLNSIQNVLSRVSTWNEQQRMFRISSDILPFYTTDQWFYIYNGSFLKEIQTSFAAIGNFARQHNIRLSFHPGQFCVLASDKETVVENSIREFEYHARMAEWMGYNEWHQDGFKINVHISGKLGVGGIRNAYSRLSTTARNLITIENEEYTYGLDDVLELADIIPVVLDVHHHWIREGHYISPSDSKVSRVVDSWRDCRPVLHYSVSRQDLLDNQALSGSGVPCLATLLNAGLKKNKLRAHSDMMWHQLMNEYVFEFWDKFDIQVEAKSKNVASIALFNEFKRLEG